MKPAFAAAAVAAGLLAGLGAGWLATRSGDAPPALEHATRFDAPRLLPDFSLVDPAGRSFGPERLRGHWTFLFFGFLNCPDICPTTLATLAATRAALDDLPAGERPSVLFVSVDPGRDTPERIGQYVAHFDPAFTGATGSRAAIDALAAALGIAVFVGPPSADGSYEVDHSAAVYLVDPQARLAALFGTPHESAAIASDYRRLVAGPQ